MRVRSKVGKCVPVVSHHTASQISEMNCDDWARSLAEYAIGRLLENEQKRSGTLSMQLKGMLKLQEKKRMKCRNHHAAAARPQAAHPMAAGLQNDGQ